METYEHILSAGKFVTDNIIKLYDPNNKEMEILEEIREEGRKKETKPKDSD